MDIDTVTQLTTATSILKTALLATRSKIRSKTVHFNAIVDVKEIECNSKSQMKTAKTNTANTEISTKATLHTEIDSKQQYYSRKRTQKINNSDNNKFGDCPL